MEELSDIYLKKNYDAQNNIYIFLKETKNKEYCILKSMDTLTEEEEIICTLKEDFKKDYYSFSDLIEPKNYVGEKGYYNKMNPFEKELYTSFVLLYKDNFHELLYDTILDTHFLAGSIFSLEDFVKVNKENNEKLFLRKLK